MLFPKRAKPAAPARRATTAPWSTTAIRLDFDRNAQVKVNMLPILSLPTRQDPPLEKEAPKKKAGKASRGATAYGKGRILN